MNPLFSLLFPALYIAFQVAEAVRPARELPKVPRWRIQGFVFFAIAGAISTNVPALLQPHLPHALDLSSLGVLGAVPAVLVIELLIYGVHRARHRFTPLWRLHQTHHAAERHDISGAFFFHPLDVVISSLVVTSSTALLGVSPSAAMAAGVFGFTLTCFTHLNVKTPRWLGYFIERPESHSVHHARGVHAFNYCELPIIDMLFGTFRNPELFEEKQGYFDGSSQQLGRLLLALDATSPRPSRTAPAVVVVAAVVAGSLFAMRASANEPALLHEAKVNPALAEAELLPNAQKYRAHFLAQKSALMGPTSLANILRSRGNVDVTEDDLLDGSGKCRFFHKCFGGLTLDDELDIARHAHLDATVVRDVTLEEFRKVIATANGDVRISANYSRAVLYGEGAGHHSPIAGYLADKDLVLILDVNPAVGAILVPTERLFDAVNTVDDSSGKKRGLLVVR